MKLFTRITVTATLLIALAGVALPPAEAASTREPVAVTILGWWCRVTHLC